MKSIKSKEMGFSNLTALVVFGLQLQLAVSPGNETLFMLLMKKG